MDRISTLFEWASYETKAAAISQERRAEESQLEQLKIRLYDKIRETEEREQGKTAA